MDLNLPLLRLAQLGLLFRSGGAGTLPAPSSSQHASGEGPCSEEEASLHPADECVAGSKQTRLVAPGAAVEGWVGVCKTMGVFGRAGGSNCVLAFEAKGEPASCSPDSAPERLQKLHFYALAVVWVCWPVDACFARLGLGFGQLVTRTHIQSNWAAVQAPAKQ